LAKKPARLSPRMTRRDFQILAEMRAREAAVLARSGNEEGAYYLGGLAIECALKACIAKRIKRHDFTPDMDDARKVYTHLLGNLLELAELENDLDKAMKGNRALTVSWGVVKNWRVESRYETSGLKGTDMVGAVNSRDGVLPWIQRRW